MSIIYNSVASCRGRIAPQLFTNLLGGNINCIVANEFYPAASANRCAEKFVTRVNSRNLDNFSCFIRETFPENVTPISYFRWLLPKPVENNGCIGAVCIGEAIYPPPQREIEADLKWIVRLALDSPPDAKVRFRDPYMEIPVSPGQLLVVSSDLPLTFPGDSVSLIAKMALRNEQLILWS